MNAWKACSIIAGWIAVSILGINAISSPSDKKSSPPIAIEAAAPNLSGYYTVKGKEQDGKEYTGIAVIKRQADVYVVQWVIGAGATFTGIGIRQGNTLSVSWAMPGPQAGPTIRGVNVYKISQGKLSGKWTTLPGPGKLSDETLTFLKALGD